MRKFKRFNVILLIFSLFISIQANASVSTTKQSTANYTVLTDNINNSERDERLYRVIELENQMKVLLISDQNAVKSLASLALPVGSLHDPKSQQGLAHYTEHMVLMGSKKYLQPSSFSEYLSQHAGSYNASTAAYRTAYYFEVENNAFAGALDRLADAIAAPLLNAENADKERNAVNAELTMARSNDGFRIGQVESETINQDHPSAMFSGGNLETLSDKDGSILQTELENFYGKYYSANIMVGVIYSNQPLDELANLATQTFGRIQNKQISVEPIEQNALTADTLGKWIYMEPAQPKKVLYIQFPIENNLSEFANKSDEYIGYMISKHSKNTLFDALQKQGLIESISASANPTRYGNSGVFSIYATLTDKGLAQKDRVLANMFSYLDLLESQGVSQNYYDEIKKVLALEFKFPDITRDMSYVEWLSDQMLFYPTEHILDADYIATHFDENAIKQRLKSLTLKQARVWVIAPSLDTDKKAYFVDAPYRVEDITQLQRDDIMNHADAIKLQLPELNPYIPTQFVIPKVKMQSNKHNECETSGNHIHFKTNHFMDEPKAAIALSLRNNSALSTAKDQVIFSLLDYLANRELAQFLFQTNVAGINISTQADSGLMITASGFNQYLTDAVKQVVNTYRTFDIDDESLALAKSSYLEKLDAADHAKSFQLAMQPVYALSNNFYTDRNERREIVSSITVQDLEQYRENLFYNAVPYMLTVGNLYYTKPYNLYRQIKDELNAKAHYQPEQIIKIENQSDALITQKAVSTDNALLMSFTPSGYDKITGQVSSYLLYKIISPWFYDQLRSQEQLGYAVFALPVYIGDSSGIGFLIQSNEYDPAHLNERYQAFYPIILDKLNALTDDEFEQYRQSVINELMMPPQTLDEEFGEYLADFRQSLFDFDSKQQKVEQLKHLTKQDIITFFSRSVIERDGLVLASQVIGNQPEKTIHQVKGITSFSNATELQQWLKESISKQQ